MQAEAMALELGGRELGLRQYLSNFIRHVNPTFLVKNFDACRFSPTKPLNPMRWATLMGLKDDKAQHRHRLEARVGFDIGIVAHVWTLASRC